MAALGSLLHAFDGVKAYVVKCLCKGECYILLFVSFLPPTAATVTIVTTVCRSVEELMLISCVDLRVGVPLEQNGTSSPGDGFSSVKPELTSHKVLISVHKQADECKWDSGKR